MTRENEKVQGVKKITVRGGDTLWSLAAEHLGDPYLWPALYRANQRVIMHAQRFKERRHMKGPDWIFDGTVLTVYPVSGQSDFCRRVPSDPGVSPPARSPS
jgi:nucleoid-associated protein YgaU